MLQETPIQISYTNLLALIINAKGNIRFVTKPMATLLGYSIEELIGIDINQLFHQRELLQLKELITGLNKTATRTFQDFPSNMKTKHGQMLDLNLKIIQLNNSFLEEYSYVVLSDNVIYRNFVKQVFEASDHQIKELYNIANEMVMILNKHQQIVYLNEKWQQKLDINILPDNTYKLSEIFDKETSHSLEQAIQKADNQPHISRLSIRIKSANKGRYHYLKGYLLLEFKAGKPFIYQCIFNDISDEVRSEKVKNLYFNISNQLVENTDLLTIYRNIHEELKEVVACENLYIALYNPEEETDYIHFPYFIDKGQTVKSGIKRPVNKGITEYAITKGAPLSLSRKQIEALTKQKHITLMGEIPEHWMGVPLHTPDKVIGIIAIQSYIPHFNYTDADLKLLDFASSQIAMAIEMAKTREDLQNQTAQLNAIFDSSSHLIWSVNRNLEVTSFNKNYFEANFISHDIGPSPTNENNSDSFNNFWVEKYEQAFKGEKLQFEINLKDDQGNIIWKEIHLNPIYTRHNKIEEVSGIAHDITPKKQSELALLKSEEKFRNIFESFQDLYFRCNIYGSIIMVSPSIVDMMGYQAHEVIGKHIDDYYLYNPRAKRILKELKHQKNLKNVEVSIVKKNGEVRQCICNIRMVQNNPNEPFEVEGVVRDITQLKITNQQLINANEIAENSLRVKEQFLANMSHEIRTPMNGIIGMIDLLDNSNLSHEQQGYVGTLKKSSTILMDILNDILDLAKIEAGRMELKNSSFSLPYVVEKIHALFLPIASTRQVNLHYHINEALPNIVTTDETRLIQVLSNLISNSLKFTDKGGAIDIGFELLGKNENQALIRVDVRDSGIGISQENQKLLFKSFEQLDASTTKAYGGTGLGLAISKQLVHLLGGQIGVFSNPGLGSTFWFTFKALIPDNQEVKETDLVTEKNNIVTTQLHSKNVLVVDDNQINREVASEILAKAGCNVQVAASGEAALQMAKNNAFDVIFMDIQMPGMDGVETTKELRKLPLTPVPKIIAMTAYAMKEDKEKFLNQGMDDYLAKPIRANLLISKVTATTTVAPEPTTQTTPDNTPLPIVNQDVVAQLKKYGGDDIVGSVYNEFTAETETQLTEAQQALNHNKWEEVRKLLHTIKGTAGTLGIEKVAYTARILELRLKENNISSFKSDFLKLIDNFDEFKNTFKDLI